MLTGTAWYIHGHMLDFLDGTVNCDADRHCMTPNPTAISAGAHIASGTGAPQAWPECTSSRGSWQPMPCSQAAYRQRCDARSCQHGNTPGMST
eukprot:313247-Pelagomonas_calceolata.AAC.9